ncbi:DUF4249 domain-containing protein [Porifericola rhodea]|uniref:DUF4249 domain-containing protein n=1 Tax=Porifericola rhodea TaxID=930972 RepID=UPI002666960E|nr:DUF4249 domain-containing protein [Porifericola rhodea]WKN33883.1 DUF4249 domain-containing protein [Porifericola rhodea]
MKNLSFILFANFILLLACEEVPVFDETQQRPVVQAFLYADEAVDSIQLTTLVPFGSESEEAPPITNAQLKISSAGEEYVLSHLEEKAGYYAYSGSNLEIKVGQTYQLSFEYNGELVSAETTVPTPPQHLSLEVEEIFLPQISSQEDLFTNRELMQQTIALDWDYEEGAYYYVLIENLEDDPEPINQLDINFAPFARFISAPSQDNFMSIRPLLQFQSFGTHRIRVYKLNEEYAKLYESLEQDSRNLNEPYSNIQNGLGIFTAFSSQEVFLEVVKQ